MRRTPSTIGLTEADVYGLLYGPRPAFPLRRTSIADTARSAEAAAALDRPDEDRPRIVGSVRRVERRVRPPGGPAAV